jgi:hypothetical protein
LLLLLIACRVSALVLSCLHIMLPENRLLRLTHCPCLQVYHRGMQLMQSRLRGLPEAGGLAAQQHASAPGTAAGWQGWQGEPAMHIGGAAAAAVQQQQQQQQQLLQQQAMAQAQAEYEQQLAYQYQQQQEQQLLLQRQQQRYLQQQAEAEAFPAINAFVPEWDDTAAGQRQQSVRQREQPGLPLLPAGRAWGGSLPASHQAGGGAGWMGQPQQQPQHAAWRQQRQGQQGQGHVDEFGVSMQPSMSDDESDNNLLESHARQAEQPPPVRQMHQLLLPGRGGGGAAALYGQAAAAAGGAADGSGADEGGHMGAFLSSRKRDFCVPHMPKPVASRQLTPQQHMRGAGQLGAAQEPG